jgi:hypothetical protein
MIRNETMHRYVGFSATCSVDLREEAPKEVVLLRLGEEFGPEALRVEDVLKNG